jgi:hypothetical protein
MTPKEKAEELVESFTSFSSNEATTEDGFIYSEAIQLWNAKQCALIAVDEIINEYGTYYKIIVEDKQVVYWEEVKQEIEKL